MAEGDTPATTSGGVTIDKETVKQALTEILAELPGFRALAKGDGSSSSKERDPARTDSHAGGKYLCLILADAGRRSDQGTAAPARRAGLSTRHCGSIRGRVSA